MHTEGTWRKLIAVHQCSADLYRTACVARTDLAACARDDAHCEGVIQPKWVANGKHLLPNQQIRGISKLGWVQ